MNQRGVAKLLVVALALGLGACGPPHRAHLGEPASAPSTAAAPMPPERGLRFGPPDEEGVDAAPLLELTKWIEGSTRRVFSILVSKNGRVIYELYTSRLSREHAHYMMSVTKSVLSALIGIAMAENRLPSPEASVADVLPPEVFPSPADIERFRPVTIKDVLGMSALDAAVPPHRSLPEDVARQKAFVAAPNRTKFALGQLLLPEPGVSFQYTDVTPAIASGMLTYATGKTVFDYANERLFGPLGFRHQEWMHEDAAGIDNGAYGLRLRPIDMQKFGNLYLNGGEWGGKQIVPADWVKQSFTPWITPKPFLKKPIYGWYWWELEFGPHFVAHAAVGWKGQRIAVIPEQNVVVTMTGNIGDDEMAYFNQVMNSYVVPALGSGRKRPDLRRNLREALERVRNGEPRFGNTEKRLIPSIEPLETHHPFRP